MADDRFWAVVPAAGVGKRMAATRPKQYLALRGLPIIQHTIERLSGHPRIAGVVVALSPEDGFWPELRPVLPASVHEVLGGEERCHSVLRGLERLEELAAADDWVLVHDAVRPCLRSEDIDKLIAALATARDGALLGYPVRDTIKRTDQHAVVRETVPRDALWHALTPQAFRVKVLKDALAWCIDAGHMVTDEAQAVELGGMSPTMVEGCPDNIKITRPDDLGLAELYLRHQEDAT